MLGFSGSDRPAFPAEDPIQPRQAIIISDDTFLPQAWRETAEVNGDASYTVSQQLTGGDTTPPFRLMSHRLGPVSTGDFHTVSVTHVYQVANYTPILQGAISAIDYGESGIILSFPFDEAFSTTQPVIVQDGVTYRSTKFLRFIAQNGSHSWESKTLNQLTAEDFIPVGGPENQHPNFSASGSRMQFGFARSNSRSSTLPPVPAEQEMIIEQGVDTWFVAIHPTGNRPPQAVDDVFILDGENRSLPLIEFFDVVDNDSDPDADTLEITGVTEPLYGTAGILSSHTAVYQLDEARASDHFTYTISDDLLTDTARVDVLIDCACTVLCLNQFELPRGQRVDTIDLPLIYRFRDQVLRRTADGMRYNDIYYENNPEILVNILMNEPLRIEAVDTVELWQENLRSLTDGDGRAVITQGQIDALELFLSHLAALSSPELQQVIAAELQRIGPLDDYVGMTVGEAKRLVLGDPRSFAPYISR
jgi:hypothetical protein